jgi:8-oxo-dGTP diphosphatase
VPTNKLFAASCHNIKEINQANRLGADFIVLGSVRATTSHPNNTTIGWDKFTQLAELALMPVFALGGMSIDDADHSRECGGQGVAAISSLWHDC